MRSSGLPTMPCAAVSRAFGPTGDFISMGTPSGPGDLGQHAVQGSPRQRNLEIVAADSARAGDHRIGRRVKARRARWRVAQSFLGLRDAPGLVGQTTEGEPRRTDSPARGIDDGRDGDERKGVGGAGANLGIDLYARWWRR